MNVECCTSVAMTENTRKRPGIAAQYSAHIASRKKDAKQTGM